MGKRMLEKLINLKIAMKRNKPKSEIKEKFKDYSTAYDNCDKTIQDKIRHREVFYDYVRYMAKSGGTE